MLDFGYYNMDCIDYKNVIQMNEKIKNQSEIARELNIDVSTVNRMLKPNFIPFETKAKYFSDIERSDEWFLKI